jgi:predicted TIM-barrel fold metal-dependent hydrolase
VSTVDVNTFVGGRPHRRVPHPEAEILVRVLAREEVTGAWVGHLPSAFEPDPQPGNEALFAALAPHAASLSAVPAIRPGRAHWERDLAHAIERGGIAIRAYPPQWGMNAGDPAMRSLAAACGEAGVPLVLTVRFDDARGRDVTDTAADLSAAAVRSVMRASPRVRVLVTAAGRAFIDETRAALEPAERARLWWDTSWIGGPPTHDLAQLIRAEGASRFVYGSGWPLRLTQTPKANLELLPRDLRAAHLGAAADLLSR